MINDFYDIDTDKINKPQRPLISNTYNLKTVYLISIFMLLVGILFSAFISLFTVFIAMISAILLFLYSKYFKAMPVIGNLVIAILSGLLFVYGALIADNISGGIFPALFAFLITFEDMEGDRDAGMTTLPILIGKQKAFIIAVIDFIVLISMTFIPYFTGMYNRWYFFIIVFGVNLVLLTLLFMFYFFDDLKTKRFVNNYIKYDMIIGLLAIIMGIK